MPGASLLTRAELFAQRHDKALSALALVWFVLTTADTARFIDLPELPFMGRNFWIFFAAGWNAVWWGFARPALVRRREERRAALGQDPAIPG